MEFKEDNGKLYVIEDEEIVLHVGKWKKHERFCGGRVVEKKFHDFSKFLKRFSREFKKVYPEHSLILNFEQKINYESNSSDYIILDRIFMSIKLGNLFEEPEENFVPLRFEKLESYANEIYEAIPWYDKLLMGVKNPYELNEFFEEVDRGNYGYVLKELSFQLENPFRGFIFTLEENDSGILIGDVVVLPEFRRQGLGTKLIKKVLYTAQKKGYKEAFLFVTDDNFAKRLYRKVGFEEIDVTSLLIIR
ncbi:GNAT family N-acetyltransferase [Thermosipho ferrireducens]|uniref:GNAT family N-acetyltransferase n=1 Tax=Thermosipho ferrireducens TaxID=2571116 RepID=A0ABX7S5E9_9BACT|nr:GNAT family N-acetyltransferase [Thermosipho ferrireducens]QTA37753.1 GNAT family N-acetyltransferase [Thermosipho ferrireducens]